MSKSRRETALAVANSDRRLKPFFAGRNRPVLVEPNLHDPHRPDASDIVVGLYDYDHGRSVIALVDPEAKKVVGVEETEAQFQLSDEERREAEELATRDERVAKFLGRRRANPLTRLYFPPGSARKKPHRYAIVFLRPTSSERRYAVVDLTARKTIDVLDSLIG